MTMLIRLGGSCLFVLGALVVIHDLATIFVYGEPDATVLALLLAFSQSSGHEAWVALLMWIMPVAMGAAMLFVPSARPLRQPGT